MRRGALIAVGHDNNASAAYGTGRTGAGEAT